ncbi:hypothetical protein BH11VER1_BH11VER1_03000 [soil metagenome]
MKYQTTLLLLAAGMCSGLQAGETMTASGKGVEAAVQKTDSRSIYDKIWGLATLYKDDNNPVLQEFSLQGRLQLQYAAGDSDQGSYGSGDRPEELRWGDIEVRRWRLGFKSKWFRQFKLEGQIDVNPNFSLEPGANPTLNDGFYRDIYDLYATWAPSDAFNLSVGKTKAKFFSTEYFTSSKEIIVFERGLLVNTLVPKELTGVWTNGKIGNWIYAGALYAGDYNAEFANFDAGSVFQLSLGYDFASAVNMEKAIVKLDYQYSSSADNSDAPAKFDNAFDLNTQWEKGRFAIYGDVIGATGRGTQGDVFGVIVTPSVYIADSLQLVFRYQYAQGDSNGLQLQSRYERLAPELDAKGKGETYNAAYLGLNYYLYGNKLKLMTGLEYNNMSAAKGGDDFSGWTYLAGMRMFF